MRQRARVGVGSASHTASMELAPGLDVAVKAVVVVLSVYPIMPPRSGLVAGSAR